MTARKLEFAPRAGQAIPIGGSTLLCTSFTRPTWRSSSRLLAAGGLARTVFPDVPDVPSRPAQAMLENAKWQTVRWRRGTKGKLAARFAAMRVRVADGPPQRIGHLGQRHLPGEEVWRVGEHRSSGERKYDLSNLPADTPLKKLAGAIKARWVCGQAHQRLKEELGLDHFEGRSWQGCTDMR